MKLLLFSGTHPRHLFVNKELLKRFEEVLVIVMQREELLPSPPPDLTGHDRRLFERHFLNRYNVERKTYGDLKAEEIYKGCKVITVSPAELNTLALATEVEGFGADFCFIFGVDLILEPLIDVLPKDKINLHLGLSPWYKGGATLYWPFYHLEPQFCGVTFHQITTSADAGEIIHQCVPELKRGDSIHHVGARCVMKARDDLKKIIDHWDKFGEFSGLLQTTSGRNWRGVDFQPAQLRVIYDLFEDSIVDQYLDGKLGSRAPKLFSCLENC